MSLAARPAGPFNTKHCRALVTGIAVTSHTCECITLCTDHPLPLPGDYLVGRTCQSGHIQQARNVWHGIWPLLHHTQPIGADGSPCCLLRAGHATRWRAALEMARRLPQPGKAVHARLWG